MSEVKWLKSQTEEILKRLDLDEIDLQTERLKIFFTSGANSWKSSLKKELLVPRLDFSKIFEWREQQNQEEEEEELDEEEFEEEDDIKSEYNEYFAAGTDLHTDSSATRKK